MTYARCAAPLRVVHMNISPILTDASQISTETSQLITTLSQMTTKSSQLRTACLSNSLILNIKPHFSGTARRF
jgi:hypothetical protein